MKGRLVLQKKGRPAMSPSAYRPICVLDETGKLFERIISAHLVEHLRSVGPNLSAHQYGFREGRSTIDAVKHVKALSDETVAQGGVAIAMSFDISNAFNTLPWARIREALRYHRVPSYLRRIVGAFLKDRTIVFRGRYGEHHRRGIQCGVPQGSVLGPLLWNLGYDGILRSALSLGLSVVCYADDTLLLARGNNWRRTVALATVGAAHLIWRIEGLGLRVMLDKTEALWIHGPRRKPPVKQSWLLINETHVSVKASMKYLGLILDSRWGFREHFNRLTPKAMAMANSLARLMPNLGGPRVRARCLLGSVVRSVALYGAPVLMASKDNRAVLRPCRGSWPSGRYEDTAPSPTRRRAYWRGLRPGK